jgi:hypothetical protein
MAITDTKTEYLKPYLAQVFKYIDAPENPSQIYVRTDTVDNHFDMPENVWFIFTLADGEKITDIPRYILDTACVVDLTIREVKEDAKKKASKKAKAEKEVQAEELVQTEEQEQAQDLSQSTEELPIADILAEVEKSIENMEKTTIRVVTIVRIVMDMGVFLSPLSIFHPEEMMR